LLARPHYRASLGRRAQAATLERFNDLRVLKMFGAFLEELEEVTLQPETAFRHSAEHDSGKVPSA
jgi:hypothetical protein